MYVLVLYMFMGDVAYVTYTRMACVYVTQKIREFLNLIDIRDLLSSGEYVSVCVCVFYSI